MQRFVIANWKMYLSFNEVRSWLEKNSAQLDALQKSSGTQIILCPSGESLSIAAEKLQNTQMALGAQNCSAYETGPYAGQIAARSLHEIGCRWCIVGHSEVRQACVENEETISKKIEQLFNNNITPIVCVGETLEEYQSKNELEKIVEQLKPIQLALDRQKQPQMVCVAYEPLWSIGTGIVADCAYLEDVFWQLEAIFESYKDLHSVVLLYGGSVSENNAARLWQIPQIAGFLVGKASTDFQLLKKIVLSRRE
jgi:triosephosphate isomerase